MEIGEEDYIRSAHASIGEALKTLRTSGKLFPKAAVRLTNMEMPKGLIRKMLAMLAATRDIIAHHMKRAAGRDEFRGKAQ